VFERIDVKKLGPPIKIHRHKGVSTIIKAKNGKTKTKRRRKR